MARKRDQKTDEKSDRYHYHSIYDSQRWQELYADPGFHRHVAVAKLLGLQTLRLASDVILPFNTTHYSLLIERFVDEQVTSFGPDNHC